MEPVMKRWTMWVIDGTDGYRVSGNAPDEETAKEKAIAYIENKYGTSYWRVRELKEIPAKT